MLMIDDLNTMSASLRMCLLISFKISIMINTKILSFHKKLLINLFYL